MDFLGVRFTKPSSSLFKFPPNADPLTLRPPTVGSSVVAPPFEIPSPLFSDVFDVRVPITIACIYAVSVTAVNAYNRSRGNKPWRISKWKSFFWFVVAHNVFLAVYSGWTFVGMLGALRRTVQNPMGPAGLAGTVDSLCKMHGTSGLGNAVAYSPESSAWVSQSSSVRLSAAGTPDGANLGRLWNEGLAFYGWFFYLSKFYEVLDTFIILAKGKRSSTLQTYHHAGAMMCMWSGMRFMSTPIWMFVFVNSGIHALMYTYYTLTAFSVPIPRSLKRSLTTMQIIQFLVGASYAATHSFISYSIPVLVPTTSSSSSIQDPVPAATSAVASGVPNLLKKLLSSIVGEANANFNAATQAQVKAASGPAGFTTEYQTIPCIDTNGQTFAIWLNVVYLAPLTVLFMRFFFKSYIRMAGGAKKTEKSNGVAVNGKAVNGNGHINGYANGHANGKAVNGKATNGKAH